MRYSQMATMEKRILGIQAASRGGKFPLVEKVSENLSITTKMAAVIIPTTSLAKASPSLQPWVAILTFIGMRQPPSATPLLDTPRFHGMRFKPKLEVSSMQYPKSLGIPMSAHPKYQIRTYDPRPFTQIPSSNI